MIREETAADGCTMVTFYQEESDPENTALLAAKEHFLAMIPKHRPDVGVAVEIPFAEYSANAFNLRATEHHTNLGRFYEIQVKLGYEGATAKERTFNVAATCVALDQYMVSSQEVLELDEARQLFYFSAAHRLADFIFEHISPRSGDEVYMEDRRSSMVRSNIDQRTQCGLVLRLSGGWPISIWTPLGEWQIGGSSHSAYGDEKHIVAHILEEHCSVVTLEPEQAATQGEAGPLYSVLAIDGHKLPDPVVITKSKVDLERDHEMWQRLTRIMREV